MKLCNHEIMRLYKYVIKCGLLPLRSFFPHSHRPLLHRLCYIAFAISPLLHRLCYIAFATSPLLHRHPKFSTAKLLKRQIDCQFNSLTVSTSSSSCRRFKALSLSALSLNHSKFIWILSLWSNWHWLYLLNQLRSAILLIVMNVSITCLLAGNRPSL